MPDVFAFHHPHEVGSICRHPCPQCGDEAAGGYLLNAFSERVEHIPMLILREATEADWRRGIEADGGTSEDAVPLPYFYFVSVD